MELTRAYKFRIYPDATRQAEIDERLVLAQQFYNKILEKSVASYRNGKTKVSIAQFNKFVKEIIQEDKRYLKLYSQTRCEIEYRLMKAYQNFFRRLKEGNRKAGFPRFRSRDRYKSLTYPQDNGSFSIEKIKKEDRLRVSRIGTMKIEFHRPIGGKIKMLSIKREAGNYYAIFITSTETAIPKVKDTAPVGIDMGLNTFAMLSDFTKIEKPKFARKKERKLAHWQRIIAKKDEVAKRQKRGKYTSNRRRAVIRLQDAWNDVNNQNDDFMQKATTNLVDSGEYTSFKMEALQPQNMMKNHNLARSIGEASWSKFRQILSYKAESAGMEVNLVDPRDTTQECSICHNVKKGREKLALKDRIYQCYACGMRMNRGLNSARVINYRPILEKAREGHSRSNAFGGAASTFQKGMQTTPVNQEHTLPRFDAGEAHTIYRWEDVTF
ncbi:MAG: transposase [Candidatus Marsarchaeota archaeon]|nr:transposase [Candidatus Marsarchaeota archaeon]MCL5413009.1 transposase [Candidatus Marsarchaeota archaeon]